MFLSMPDVLQEFALNSEKRHRILEPQLPKPHSMNSLDRGFMGFQWSFSGFIYACFWLESGGLEQYDRFGAGSFG